MEEALIKRVLPHSVEAEQSVIGSMLMDRDAIMAASEIITGEDFYQHQYGVLFEAMVELYNEGKPVDLVTLQDRLREKDVPPEIQQSGICPGTAYMRCPLLPMSNIMPISLQEKSMLRKLIQADRGNCQHLLCWQREDWKTFWKTTEKKVFDLVQQRDTGDFVPDPSGGFKCAGQNRGGFQE